MKKIIITLILWTLSSLALASEIEVKVSGMVCSMCAQGIEKKFNSHPAVKSIKVDMDEKLVTLHLHPEAKLEDKELTTLIQEAGYHVASIKRK
jgi:copper chaperone CopZ